MKHKINPQAVYDFLTTIPQGKVVTYGMIAAHLGNRHYARTVGNILHQNPNGDCYPCYKVVNSRGKLTAHYAFGGMEKQKERLERDGIHVENNQVDLKRYGWDNA